MGGYWDNETNKEHSNCSATLAATIVRLWKKD